MTPPHTASRSVSAALARDRLGVPSVVYFVLGGIAPLTVAAGVIPTAYAVAGLTSIPAAFLVVALVLAVFSAGYVAMARHITNSGAFYAFVTRGIGRPVGVSAAMVALVAYLLLQVGLYGMFGPATASLAADKLGIHAPWWGWALGAWAIVAVLGLLRVDVNGKVLAVLCTIEIAVIAALGLSGLRHPAAGRLSLATLAPTDLIHSGVGALLVIAVLGYVGFESSAVFAEESKHPRRTVPTATYLCLAMIAIVYAGVSWVMAAHYGQSAIVGTAQSLGPQTLFGLGSSRLGEVGQVLFLTSLFAAMLAFHNACWRYMFALGREQVLPAALGRTGANNIPKAASLTQSVIGLAVIVLYAVTGWDPTVKLFFWLGTTGGFGILVLLAVTAFAVIGFFARNPRGESGWARLFAPAVAGVLLLVMVWLAVANYATLLGVAPGSTIARVLPAGYAVAAAIGLLWAFVLKARRPDVYATIGLGADTAAVVIQPGPAGASTHRVADPHAGLR
jgi:amino acid transporter